MNKTTRKHYDRLAQRGWRVRDALRQARTYAAWDDADGVVCYSCGYGPRTDRDGARCMDCCEATVRLLIVPDHHYSLADLAGDCYRPECNPNVPRSKLDKEYAAFVTRIEVDGVCGIVAEYRDHNGEWEHADSCFGFVGDDWRDSGYDSDGMRAALDARATVS